MINSAATIAITGASGIMGRETVKCLLSNTELCLRLLLRSTKRGRRFAAKLKKDHPDRVEIHFGDIRNYEDCLWLCDGADYIIHMAAVIPPAADHDEMLTMTTNRDGTYNMVRAAQECGGTAGFIYISTVAIYGNRNEKHPWGRVGDPLITSAFDVYGLSKTIAEYQVMESGLAKWAVLRQTGILYDNILMNNISDGLMFHTPWNTPIEWVSAKDSGILLASIINKDLEAGIKGFWRKAYNIGGGSGMRQSGYETFDDGFRLIGGSVRSFFRPDWNNPRNFHCMWFSDSDVLEEMFHFRTQSCEIFWDWFKKRHPLYAAARILPAFLIRTLAIKRLFLNSNAPAYWRKHGDKARIQAYFGGEEGFRSIPDSWDKIDIFCKSNGYEEAKQYDNSSDLDHGYDEDKKVLDIEDMKKAAAFRGGRCLSEEMQPDDLYSRLSWQCHDGHVFEASPYTIIKAGHWCPKCCHMDNTWNMDHIAKYSNFHAQIWNDSHAADERYIYRLKDGKAEMEADNG